MLPSCLIEHSHDFGTIPGAASVFLYKEQMVAVMNAYRIFIVFVVVVQSLSRIWLFCDHVDCSPSGSSFHGISQARILEVGCQFPSPGDLPNLRMELASSAWQMDSLPLSHLGSLCVYCINGIINLKILNLSYANVVFVKYPLNHQCLSILFRCVGVSRTTVTFTK